MPILHPLEPENTIVFETDERTRREPRIQSARRYLTDVARYCPNGVGEAVVKKIEHRKSSGAPHHEFLLCYVQDCNVPTRLAVIRIERFNQDDVTPDKGVPPALSPAALLSLDAMRSSSPSLFGKAVDLFTITCDIDAKRSGDTLSTLIFDDNSDFTADEAAMICKIASECADEYNALGHQCFWYAGVIYKIIQEIYSTSIAETQAEGNRRKGMGHGVKIPTQMFIPPEHAPKNLAQTHLQRWPTWKADIERVKQEKWGDGELRRDRGLQQELNIKDKEIAELRKRLKECTRA
ncbi:hypothetical protein ARMGADRAFT_1089707 [Armillaria gallica]|uniref:Uncharacterized protein n=1 Tax=Armillaria gallica TaxID=47427 RepID=A0A2H3CP50_ARMGA|nr:hypothetical protein ARMGADRAFT_1089707 [Armillaria gallica]